MAMSEHSELDSFMENLNGKLDEASIDGIIRQTVEVNGFTSRLQIKLISERDGTFAGKTTWFSINCFCISEAYVLGLWRLQTPCTIQHRPFLLFVICFPQLLAERFLYVQTDRQHLQLSFSVDLTASLSGMVLSPLATFLRLYHGPHSYGNALPCLVKGFGSIMLQVLYGNVHTLRQTCPETCQLLNLRTSLAPKLGTSSRSS